MNFIHKLFSYVTDIRLESIKTNCDQELNLYLSNGQLKLIAADAIYSYGLHYYHFVETFRKLNIEQYKIQNALILGLGMGSVMQILEKRHQLKPHYDLVENDAEIISLFHKYKGFITSAAFNLFCEDAFKFIRKPEKKYDLICMDVFNGRYVPADFERPEFLKNLKNRLAENGILIYNRIAMDTTDIQANQKFLEVFKTIFESAYVIQCSYNSMFVFHNSHREVLKQKMYNK